ncbi:hypothetical protein ACWDSJ_16925 [Nocardia sp. NPDC003482]
MCAGGTDDHRSEADGLVAIWKLEHQQIRIVSVHEVRSGRTLWAVTSRTGPDLAGAREAWPRYEALWNAVRHDLWEHYRNP